MRPTPKRLRAYQFAAIAGTSLALLYWGKLRLVGGIPRTVNAEDGRSVADGSVPGSGALGQAADGAPSRVAGQRLAGVDEAEVEPVADGGAGRP